MRSIRVAVGILFLLISMVAGVSAFGAQQPAAKHDIHRYVIVNGENTSGSWDTEEDKPAVEALRARYDGHFAWFRDGGREYVVTDPSVLSQLDKAMEPQRKVNDMQADVNEDQSRVNGLQAKVNAHQNDVNAAQREVEHRQELANRLQEAVSRGSSAVEIDKLQAELRELRAKPELSQSSVNQMQAKVNEEQRGVNAEQAKVNEKQHGVNDEQHRVSAEFKARANQIFSDALEHGVAQPLK